MQSFYSIRILESENNKVGDLFTRLVGDLFLALGYDQLQYDIHKAGREIDIQGAHRLENRRVMAECKAVKNKVGGEYINKFAGSLEAEKIENPDTLITGYFVSLWGFKGTAVEQEKKLKRLILLDGDDVIRELIRGNIITPPEKAMEIAGRCAANQSTNLKPQLKYELLAHEMGWVWAIYFEENKKRTHFALVHAGGESIDSEVAENIIKVDREVGGKLESLEYLPPKLKDSIDQNRIKEAKTKYLEYLSNECGEITLEGLPADQEVGSKRLNLENIFVPLYLETENLPNMETSYKGNVEKPEREQVGKIFTEHSRLTILAAPGGGKTTLLKRLAIAYAFPDRRGMVDDNLPEKDLLPLFIRCRQLGDLANSPISDVLRSIPQRFERKDLEEEFLYFVNSSLQTGNVLLLVDGLDEISKEGLRISFIKQLRIFLSFYPNIKIVITSREAGFRIISGSLSDCCQIYRIADLSDADIKRLTLAWNKEVVGNKPEVFTDSEKLANTICNSDRVRQLAKNPLLLTTLLLVNRWIGQLPTKRSVLYGKAIEVLLMTWNVEGHDPIDPEEAIPQLSFVAFSMMKEGMQRISFKRFKELLDMARKQMPEILGYARISASEFIQRIELRSSLMIMSGYEVERGTLYPMYEFQHLTFQEYLTARAIVDGYYPDRKDKDTILKILQPYLKKQQWKEVIPLTAILADRRAQPLIEYFINECKNFTINSTTIKWSTSPSSPVILLTQCILDEVKIAPNLLQESFEWISRRSIPEDIIYQLCTGKFGREYKEVVQKTYMSSYNDLVYLGTALSVVSDIEIKSNEESEFDKQTYENIKNLLSSENPLEKAKGATATMSSAFRSSSLSSSPESDSEQKKFLMDLGDSLLPLLYSEDVHISFPACWAYSWLGEICAWSPENNPSIISRLFDIWRGSNLEEIQYAASWAISELPLMNRDFCMFPEPDIESINFIKTQFRAEHGILLHRPKKLACLVLGYYWRRPWKDKKLVELITSKLIGEGTSLGDKNIVSLLNSLGESGEIQLQNMKKKKIIS